MRQQGSTTFVVDIDHTARSDVDLVQATAGGDTEAFAELWRRHSAAGLRAARQHRGLAEPEDVVQEAFTQIFLGVARGVVPTGAFRPYLYVVIRNLAVSSSRRRRPSPVGDSGDLADRERPQGEDLEELAIERTLADEAFRRLPRHWQDVLWYSTVEDLAPPEVGKLLGMTANAASALAVRAREGLRREWLAAHVRAVPDRPRCRACLENLPAYVRGRLSAAKSAAVARHLAGCLPCTSAEAEMADVATRLRALWMPWLVALPLPGAATGATAPTLVARLVAWARDLASPVTGSATVPVAAAVVGVVALLGGSQQFVPPEAGPVPVVASPGDTSPGTLADEPDGAGSAVGPEPTEVDEPDAAASPEQAPTTEPVPGGGPGPGTAAPPAPTPVAPGNGAPAAPVSAPTITGPESGWMPVLPVVQGTAAPGSTVTVLVNGTPSTSAAVDPAGTWSATVPTPGAGTFTVVATQAAGTDVLSSSALGPYTVEPPQLAGAVGGALALTRLPMGPAGPNEITLNIAGRPGAAYAYAYDGVEPFGLRHLDATGSASITQVNAHAGVHTVTLRYVDPVTGVRGPQAVFVVTVG